MDTKINTISYNLDLNGNTTAITVSLAGYEATGESLNGTVIIAPDDLTDGATFDTLTRPQIEKLARAKAVTYIEDSQSTTAQS